MRVLVTGGSGFIGSNFIEYLLTDSEIQRTESIEVVNLDKLTYAGQGKNIEHLGLSEHERYRFFRADICDKSSDRIISEEKPDIIFNFAAESHVDRSIIDSDNFEKSNFLGACSIFKSAIKNSIKIVHISTDEVYGSIKEKSFDETAMLNPSSPYSATKAAADISALAYFKTHKLPVIITRSANNYGRYQFPEKLLPLFITNLIQGRKVPLMYSEENPGLNVRDWLHVKDNCRAIWYVSQKGQIGEIYNIPGENEKTNIEMTKKLLSVFGYGEEMIQYVEHRKAHDFRYSITGDKLKGLGFNYKHNNLDSELKNLVEWYKNNESWWKSLKQIK